MAKLRLPQRWRDQFDIDVLTLSTKPMRDDEEVVPICYRCCTENPILNSKGDICASCKHPFQRSFVDYKVIPLVEFQLEPDISHEEAAELLAKDPGSVMSGSGGGRFEENEGGQSLQFDNEIIDDTEGDDTPFNERMQSYQQRLDGTFPPILVDRKILLSLDPSEAYQRHFKGGKYEYFCNVMAQEFPTRMCEKCQHFFLTESWEVKALSTNQCPFCRTQVQFAAPPELEESMEAEIPSMY